MIKLKKLVLFWLVITVLFDLSILIAQDESKGQEKYWVFFKDKGPASLSKTAEMLESAKKNISTRALKRRAKVKTISNLIDDHDLPVSKDYLKILENLGHKPVVISNWLNAASFWLNNSENRKLEKLPFVKKIQRVGRSSLKPQPIDIEPPAPAKFKKPGLHSLDYGESLLQNELINIPPVHDLGIIGRGVLIGMLDTGFRHRDHEVFENISILAELDFINNDGLTEDEVDQDTPGQHNHGTQTLSTIGGFKEGQLIGSAFESSFILAKTEILTQEIRQEEDFWVAGIEWLENLGADVVSSSLGYLDFYEPTDMDGNTAVTTIAADLAVGRGVVVVNSAGNERNFPWQIIISPADGDSVIAVGAIDSKGELASFSSLGPTADDRIKPDLVALGVGVRIVTPPSDKFPATNSYSSINGTSFSCPQIAGVAALILSAHPDLTPLEVQEALKMTADRTNNPDNLFGWGLVNAYEAVLYHGMAFSNLPGVSVGNNGDIEVSIKIASKFEVNPDAVFLIYENTTGNFDNELAMSKGPDQNQYITTISDFAGGKEIRMFFKAADLTGTVALHPFNAPDSFFTISDRGILVEAGAPKIPETFSLAQNYPNPFNPSTTIEYKLPVYSLVSLTIYNLLGQKIRSLLSQTQKPAGPHRVIWDGKDDSGRRVAAGVYFYKLKANDFSKVKKMIIVR